MTKLANRYGRLAVYGIHHAPNLRLHKDRSFFAACQGAALTSISNFGPFPRIPNIDK